MTPIELKVARLEREQTNLVRVLFDIIGDVQYLLQLVDPNDLSINDCDLIKKHFDDATKMAENLVEGE